MSRSILIASILFTSIGLLGCTTHVSEGPSALLETVSAETVTPREHAGEVIADESRPDHNGPYVSVVLRGAEDIIPLHNVASEDGDVVAELAGNARRIPTTGRTMMVHGNRWIELVAEDGTVGWTSDHYFTEHVESSMFCSDRDATDVLIGLDLALEERSSERLFGLISPKHGLHVQLIREGTVAHFRDTDAEQLLSSTQAIDWGMEPGTGDRVLGSARDLVLADLHEAVRQTRGSGASDAACNTFVTGATTYDVEPMAGFENLNFFSLAVPASNTHGLDWMTWIVGIEYVEGVPYLVSAQRLLWEP